MIIDLAVLGLLLIFAIRGYRNGFVPSLLGLAGYLSGGFLGLVAAKEISADWIGFWSVVGVHIIFILFGAKIGQTILRSLGKGIRGLVGPLRIFDSLIGALFGLGKGVLLSYLVIQLLPTLSNESIDRSLKESEVAQYFQTHTPKLVDQGFEKLRQISR